MAVSGNGGVLLDASGVIQFNLDANATIAGYAAGFFAWPVSRDGTVLGVAESSQSRSYLNGFARDSSGYLIVDSSSSPAGYVGGFGVSATGALCYAASGTPTGYAGGAALLATGKAIERPALRILTGGPSSGEIGAYTLAARSGQAVTVTRATPGFVQLANGTLRLMRPGQPRVDSTGLLVETATANGVIGTLVGGPTWAVTNLTIAAPTVTACSADVTAPDGSQTACRLDYPTWANAGYSLVYTQNLGVQGPCSIYLRTLSGTATVALSDSGSTNFAVCSVTSTWTRFSMAANNGTATGQFFIGVLAVAGFPTSLPAQTIYAWGPQSEPSGRTSLTSFFPTKTNYFAGSGAQATYGGGGGTISAGPTNYDGVGNAAATYTADNTNVEHRISATSAAVPATAHTLSFIAKAGTLRYVSPWFASTGATVYSMFDLTAGTVLSNNGGTTGSITSLGSGWYRCVVSGFSFAAVAQTLLLTVGDTVAHAVPQVVWNTANGLTFYVTGVQLEPGSQASAYFETPAAITATRAADVPSVTSASLSGVALPRLTTKCTPASGSTWAQNTGSRTASWGNGSSDVSEVLPSFNAPNWAATVNNNASVGSSDTAFSLTSTTAYTLGNYFDGTKVIGVLNGTANAGTAIAGTFGSTAGGVVHLGSLRGAASFVQSMYFTDVEATSA